MTKYYIVALDICQTCNGERYVVHPDWQQFSSEANKNPNLKSEIWFNEHGYMFSNEIPPEEIPCPECDGKGEIESRMQLIDALTEIQNSGIGMLLLSQPLPDGSSEMDNNILDAENK